MGIGNLWRRGGDNRSSLQAHAVAILEAIPEVTSDQARFDVPERFRLTMKQEVREARIQFNWEFLGNDVDHAVTILFKNSAFTDADFPKRNTGRENGWKQFVQTVILNEDHPVNTAHRESESAGVQSNSTEQQRPSEGIIAAGDDRRVGATIARFPFDQISHILVLVRGDEWESRIRHVVEFPAQGAVLQEAPEVQGPKEYEEHERVEEAARAMRRTAQKIDEVKERHARGEISDDELDRIVELYKQADRNILRDITMNSGE